MTKCLSHSSVVVLVICHLSFVICHLAPAAEPTEAQLKLLKTFHAEFIPITPGEGEFPKSFTMGAKDGPKDQQPAHEVAVNYSFHIAKYEVPQNLWQAVMGEDYRKLYKSIIQEGLEQLGYVLICFGSARIYRKGLKSA